MPYLYVQSLIINELELNWVEIGHCPISTINGILLGTFYQKTLMGNGQGLKPSKRCYRLFRSNDLR